MNPIPALKFPSVTAAAALAVGLIFASGAQAAPLYTDQNFSTFPTGWTLSTPTNTSISVASGAPTTGTDTNNLHFVDNTNAALASAKVNIDGGTPQTGAITLSFDIKMTLVMVDASTSQYNKMVMRIYDSSGITNSAHTAVGMTFSRSAGAGNSSSRLTFGDQGGTSVGFFDPGSWYNISITLPAIGTTATSVITITGLDGAKVYNSSSTQVSSLSFSQAFGNSVTNFSSLSLATGSSGENTSYADANISNIVSVPEPSAGLSILVGSGLLFILRRRLR